MWGNCDTYWSIKVPGRPNLLNQQPPPTLKFPLALQNIIVHPKIAHSLIPSHHTPFILLERRISVSYITKNLIKYWCNPQIIIHFLLPPGLINSSTSRSTALCIMKKSVTCERTDTYSMTHPSVTAYGDNTRTNINLSKFIQPIATVIHHTFQPHTVPVFRHMTYLHTF